jgi:PhnB protein
MTIKAATPYLIIIGRADEAIALYQNALGASVETLQRFGDMDPNCPPALKNRVMHAVLNIGAAKIMLSDGSPDTSPGAGGTAHVALDMDDVEQCKKAFDALAVNGKAVQPLIDAPWGAMFGAVDDQFGVPWLFNCTK